VVFSSFGWAWVQASLRRPLLLLQKTDHYKGLFSDHTAEFEKMAGVKVEYVYYPSAELRSKIRLDASLGTGKLNVIYITEASGC